MGQKKLQVFVSSTYTDLQQERQAAVEAILSAGHIPAGMELFAAGNESQMGVIRQWIDESDVFLLILGGRYGSVDEKSGKSYIHLEYEYALESGKPLFAVLISEKHLQAKVKRRGLPVAETQHPKELETFRQLVRTKMVKFWSDPRDIQLAVHETLSKYAAREDLAGWVRGDQALNAGALAERQTAHLIGNYAHEFGRSIEAAKQNALSALMHCPKDLKLLERLQRLARDLDRLWDNLDRVMEAGRTGIVSGMGTPEKIVVGETLSQILEERDKYVGELPLPVEISLKLRDEFPEAVIWSNEAEFSTAVRDVIDNSIEAICCKKPSKGAVTLHLSRVSSDAAKLLFCDNGDGFAEEVAVLVNRGGTLTKEQRRGLGISLQNCRLLVEAKMKGKFFVYNDKQTGGACVEWQFPVEQ